MGPISSNRFYLHLKEIATEYFFITMGHFWFPLGKYTVSILEEKLAVTSIIHGVSIIENVQKKIFKTYITLILSLSMRDM